jgi:DNA repair exonuclease SbcCD ATPase subunit
VITDRLRGRGAQPEPAPAPASALERRRDDLAHQVAELQFDLGGLTYEMAIRDHFRLDVLTRRAAELQHADSELAEVERLLAAEQRSEAGSCPSCGAPHSRGAAFCWQCGSALLPPTA